ncbi:ferrous iron transporter B, partial [Candidatus Aerophobetes bacterium]|nr:ferrous iron transporter B [Candidatus Aerophobetes bacterium]
MQIEFEPRIEKAIQSIIQKTNLPRWQVILALEGSEEFRKKIPEAIFTESIKDIERDHQESIETIILKARFGQAGSIVSKVQKVHHRHPTWLEKLGDITVKPGVGLPLAAAILYGIFHLFITIAGWITDAVMTPFFEGPYDRFVRSLVEKFFPTGFIHDMLLGAPGAGYLESLGLLTTGIFVPVGIVLPAVLVFYVILTLLEDVGYLPRLAVLVDSVFHKIGLHGYSIVPVILAFGCAVPGAMASRILETKRQRFMVLTLLGISIPCMAQTAVILSIIGPFGVRWVILVYGILFCIFVGAGSLLNQILPGEVPEIAIEIPPYRLPRFSNLLMKTGIRLERFLLDAVPWVFVGITIVNVLYILRITHIFSEALSPLLGVWLGLPGEAIYPLVIGFLRKDVATGIIAPLLNRGLIDLYQAVVVVVILAVYFPCAATFAVFLKELGIKDT